MKSYVVWQFFRHFYTIWKRYRTDCSRIFHGIYHKHHEHVLVKETGLNVYPNYPYIEAGPDGIVCCSCHRESLLEITCPFKYRENLKGWEFDKDVLISVSGKIKKSHRYYQMQHQMFVTTKKLTFFISGQNTQNRKTFFS